MVNSTFKNASDFELRCILRENNFPNWPITETTRNVIIMKLENYVRSKENQNKKRINWLSLNNRSVSKCVPHGLSDSSQKRNIIRVKTTGSNLNTLQIKKCRTTKMYASPLISKTAGEDSDNGNFVGTDVSIHTVFKPPNGSENLKHVGVVTRLLSLRDKTLLSTRSPRSYTTEITAVKKVHNLTLPTVISGSHKREPIIFKCICFVSHNLRRCLNVTPGYKQQIFVPYALISMFLAFLIMLAWMYIVMSPGLPNSIHENSTQFNFCSNERSRQRFTEDNLHFDYNTGPLTCIEKDNLPDTIVLCKNLIRLLQEHAKQQYCSSHNNGQPVLVSKSAFIQYQIQKNDLVIDVTKIMERINDVEYLIQHNPQWGANVFTADSSPILSRNGPEEHHDSQYILNKPSLPVICALYTKIQRFFVLIGATAVLVAIFLLTYIAFRYVNGWRNDRLIAVDHFAKEILDELLYRASLVGREIANEADHVVVINHLRDKLLPLKKRNTLLWSWNKALQLLETNDSRIQFATCMRNGEEFRTMQWIGNNLEQDSRAHNKQWQSPAFDNLNKIIKPPTPCLKIRHMFDTSEINNPNLKQNIKAAILSKVGACCNICDIQIDIQSCCVYVRCASEYDAGVVHNEINGWWFDKHLISIKFLRLQRYLYHFPKSCNSNIISL